MRHEAGVEGRRRWAEKGGGAKTRELHAVGGHHAAVPRTSLFKGLAVAGAKRAVLSHGAPRTAPPRL